MLPPTQVLAHATAAVVSVGDELSLGQTTNTNSRWIAQRLTDAGIITQEHVTVPDDMEMQAAALLRLAGSVDLIIVTGGLGPTADDLTRGALARAMGDELVEDKLAIAQVEAWFLAAKRPMPQINLSQALRPSRSVILPNHHGTAPGLHAVIQAGQRCADVFCLPGPPREMYPMFHAQVGPRLKPPAGRTVRTRVLHTFGLGESDLATRLGSLMNRDGPHTLLVGTTASGGIVSCRVRYEGPLPPHDADQVVERTLREVRICAGPYVFGADEDTLPGVLFKLLKDRSEHIGTVESCTGGLLSELLTETAGASNAFAGGLITYSNSLKQSLAGVDATLFGPGLDAPGAVSREVAGAMAMGGLSKIQVEHCLAITGIAGPGGAVPAAGSRPAKPVGTIFIARASRLTAQSRPTMDVRQFQMQGDRHSIRDWSAKAAMTMLRLHLLGLEQTRLLRQVD